MKLHRKHLFDYTFYFKVEMFHRSMYSYLEKKSTSLMQYNFEKLFLLH